MQDRRRLKAYEVILHTHQHELDALTAELGAIRAQQSVLNGKFQELSHRRDTEAHNVSLEAAPFVAGFLQAIAAEQAGISEQLHALDQIGTQLEDKLRDKFIELRGWQATCDKLRKSIAYETRRQEEMQLDEVARAMFTHGRSA